VVGALLLLSAAWLVAVILRAIVRRVCRAARLDERAGSPVSGSLADIVYWFTFLFFLPGILETLGLQQLLIPVQAMVAKVMSFVPNLLAAAMIFLVGYYVAKLVREIITNLSHAAGIDRFSYNIGMAPLLGQNLLSQILGRIVFAVIIIPVTYSALNALALHSLTHPIESVFGRLLSVVPALFSAALVLLVAHYLGRFVAQLVSQFLAGTGFNSLLEGLGIPPSNDPEARTPADLVGMLTHAAITIFAVIEAANLLGFNRLSDIVAQFILFGGQLLTGVVIFAAGLYLANLAVTAIKSSGLANRDQLASGARIAVLVLATTMALRQMGLANEIIQTAFTLLLGAGAVAVAISFGIGGRDTAARMVEAWRASWLEKSLAAKTSRPPSGD
jgi:hypothetical protein